MMSEGDVSSAAQSSTSRVAISMILPQVPLETPYGGTDTSSWATRSVSSSRPTESSASFARRSAEENNVDNASSGGAPAGAAAPVSTSVPASIESSSSSTTFSASAGADHLDHLPQG